MICHRAGYGGSYDNGQAGSEDEEDEANINARKERDQLRRDRERDIQRQIRMSHMGAETKKMVMKENELRSGGSITKVADRILDRDVSEKIALGMGSGTTKTSKNEIMYDTRLFDQHQGMASGFKDEDGNFSGIIFSDFFSLCNL